MVKFHQAVFLKLQNKSSCKARSPCYKKRPCVIFHQLTKIHGNRQLYFGVITLLLRFNQKKTYIREHRLAKRSEPELQTQYLIQKGLKRNFPVCFYRVTNAFRVSMTRMLIPTSKLGSPLNKNSNTGVNHNFSEI